MKWLLFSKKILCIVVSVSYILNFECICYGQKIVVPTNIQEPYYLSPSTQIDKATLKSLFSLTQPSELFQSRRNFIKAVVGASVVALAAHHGFLYFNFAAEERIEIPEFALTFPTSTKFPQPKPRGVYKNPGEGSLDHGTRNGGPLGNIGTGSFMVNVDGQLTNLTFSAAPVLEVLPEGQTCIFVKSGGKTFAAPLGKRPKEDSRLSTWDWKTAEGVAGSFTYGQAFPFSYWKRDADNILPVGIMIRRFSPFIPGNLTASTEPVAVIEVEVSNPTDVDQEVAVLQSFPNFAGWKLKANPPGPKEKSFIFEKKGENQYHRAFDGPRNLGIVMGAVKEEDVRFSGQISIATEKKSGVQVTYHSAFDAQGSGKGVWESFAKKGRLNNVNNVNTGGKEQAGAIAVKVKLAPGETKIIPFTIAWDFPIDVRNKKEILKYYTHRYGDNGQNAYRIAINALGKREKWKDRINKWQEKICRNSKLPDFLKSMLLNELYFLTQAGSLLDLEKQMFILESIDYRVHDTLDVWAYVPTLSIMFPELEKNMMRMFSETIPIEDKTTVNYLNAFPVRYGAVNLEGAQQALDRNLGYKYGTVYPGPLKLKGAVAHHLDDLLFGPLTPELDWGGGYRQDIHRRWQNHNMWKGFSPKFVLMVWRAFYLD